MKWLSDSNKTSQKLMLLSGGIMSLIVSGCSSNVSSAGKKDGRGILASADMFGGDAGNGEPSQGGGSVPIAVNGGNLSNLIVSGLTGTVDTDSAMFMPVVATAEGHSMDPEQAFKGWAVAWEISGSAPSWINCLAADVKAIPFRCQLTGAPQNGDTLRLILRLSSKVDHVSNFEVFGNFIITNEQGVVHIDSPASDPASLRATAIGSQSVRLVWRTARSAPVAYKIASSPTSPPDEQCISGTKVSGRFFHDLTDMQPNQKYFVRVCGEGANGVRSIGQLLTFTTREKISALRVGATSFRSDGYWLSWSGGAPGAAVQILGSLGEVAPSDCKGGLSLVKGRRDLYKVVSVNPNAVNSYRICVAGVGDGVVTARSLMQDEEQQLAMEPKNVTSILNHCDRLQVRTAWQSPSSGVSGSGAISGYLFSFKELIGDQRTSAGQAPADCGASVGLASNLNSFSIDAADDRTYWVRLCSVDEFGNLSDGVTKALYVAPGHDNNCTE